MIQLSANIPFNSLYFGAFKALHRQYAFNMSIYALRQTKYRLEVFKEILQLNRACDILSM